MSICELCCVEWDEYDGQHGAVCVPLSDDRGEVDVCATCARAVAAAFARVHAEIFAGTAPVDEVEP